MAVYYFILPDDKEILTNVTCVSPIDTFTCPLKPFGDLSAEDYLEFAKKDITFRDQQSIINSFSNSKRCFHYQVERILYALGLRKAFINMPFPPKVDLLEKLEIIPGALLRTFNKERNLLEHEYTVPTLEQAENAIALCDLLRLATKDILTSLPILLRVKLSSDRRDLLYKLLPDEFRISVAEIKGTKPITNEHGEYYHDHIFEPTSQKGDRRLKEGINLETIPELEMDLSSQNLPELLKVASMFTLRYRGRFIEKFLPSDSHVTITLAIDLSLPEWKEKMKNFFGE